MNNNKSNKIIPKLLRSFAGQALTEFAVFGSLILFMLGILVSYGQQFCYQQKLDMNTYRKAYRTTAGRNVNAVYPEGYCEQGYGATVISLKDKPVVYPDENTGINPTFLYSSSASATWSQTLMGEQMFNESNIEGYLPRVIYDINGDEYTFTTGRFELIEVPRPAPVDPENPQPVEEFRIRLMKQINTPGGELNYEIGANAYWKWTEWFNVSRVIDGSGGISVNGSAFKIAYDDEVDEYNLEYDIDEDGEEDVVGAISIEGMDERREKLVVGIRVTVSNPEEVAAAQSSGMMYINPMSVADYYIDAFEVLDYGEGDIDLVYDSQDAADGVPYQGVLPDQQHILATDVNIEKYESPTRIKVVNTVDKVETISRKMRLNRPEAHPDTYEQDGQYYMNHTSVKSEDRKWSWRSPWVDVDDYDWGYDANTSWYSDF